MGSETLKGFVSVPPMFIEAGSPLRIPLYLYFPLERKMYCYKQKSEVLDIQALGELLALGASAKVLTPTQEYQSALEALDRFDACEAEVA